MAGCADFFVGLQRKPFIVNTSRGEVIEEQLALLDALKTGRIRDAVIDTWEDRPGYYAGSLLQKAFGNPSV